VKGGRDCAKRPSPDTAVRAGCLLDTTNPIRHARLDTLEVFEVPRVYQFRYPSTLKMQELFILSDVSLVIYSGNYNDCIRAGRFW